MRYSTIRSGCSVLLAVVFLAAALMYARSDAHAEQAAEEVDVLIVLAIDTSSSINNIEWDLQRLGYVEAFRSREVLRAIQRGMVGKIAVAVVQWADIAREAIHWSLIHDGETLSAFANKLETMPRINLGTMTDIGGGLLASEQLLHSASYRGLRRVIDISGDGKNSESSKGSLQMLRKRLIESGIVINGLPILDEETDIQEYYQNHVRGGAGSFIVVANGFDNFPEAIRKKLILEIALAPYSQ